MSNYPIIEDTDLGRVSASVSDTTDCGLITESVDVTYDLGGDINSYLYTQYPAPLVNDLVFTAIGRIASEVLEYNSNYNTIKIAKFPSMTFTRNDSKYQVWYAPIQRYIQPITFTIVPTPENATVILEAEGFVQEGTSITVDSGTVVEYTVICEGYESVSGTYTVTERTVLSVELSRNAFTLTIVPTPADATVSFDTGTVSGNTTTVNYNTDVTYTVSKTGYTTTSSIVNVKEDKTVSVSLSKNNYTLSISPTPADATVTLTAAGYTQSGNSITVPFETEVQWTVSKNHYITRSGSQVVTNNNTIPVQLTEMVSLTIVPTPANATVTLTAAGSTQEGNSIWVPANTEVAYSVNKQYYNTTTGNVTVSTNETLNITLTTDYYIPAVNEVVVNLTGSTKYESNTKFMPGRYRVEVAPGRTGYSMTSEPQTYVSNMNHVENIREPFIIRAYCGANGNATNRITGTNPYSGAFKVNAIQNPSRVAGIDVNHIFGAGGGNNYFGSGVFPQVLGGGGGNCLGNGISRTDSTFGLETYTGAGSCCHIMPLNGVFGTNYLRAYHACALNGFAGQGSAYGGAGTGVGPAHGYANNWYTRGGNSPYGTGATAEYSAGTGVGAGGKKIHGVVSGIEGDYEIGAGAYFNGSQWIDEPGNLTNQGSSYIKITYLGPLS